jgi:hypothetical protein
MDWIYLTQVRVKWRVPVNTIMNRRGSIKMGNFLPN